MIQGIDCHAGYGAINWAVACAMVRFCYVKCTTGNQSGVDAQFVANVAGCRERCVAVGAYHFAFPLPDHPDHPGRSPEEQAERAYRDSDGLGSCPGDLPHAVDAEWPAPQDAAGWGCTRPQIGEWLRRYCVRATALWGRPPVIYTYPSWWRWLSEGADVSWASEYLLWLADYDHPGPGMPRDGQQPSHLPWLARTWERETIWQYSADGSTERIPGIQAAAVDRNCIRDEATLARLRGVAEVIAIDGGTVHPPVPLPEPPEPEAA